VAAAVLAFTACIAVLVITNTEDNGETARASVSGVLRKSTSGRVSQITGQDVAETLELMENDVGEMMPPAITTVELPKQTQPLPEAAHDVVYGDATEQMPPTGPSKPEQPPVRPSSYEIPHTVPTPFPTKPPTSKPSRPKAAPKPTPITCASCISAFVDNKGCKLWKEGIDPKVAIPKNCRGDKSPLLKHASCEEKLARVCGMSKKSFDDQLEHNMEPCSADQEKEMLNSESGHLGCTAGGKCVDNLGYTQCSCKKGFSGRACDMGPVGNSNVSVSNELLLGMNLFTCPGEGIKDWTGFHQLSIASNLAATVQPLHEHHLQFGQGEADVEGRTAHLAVFEAPSLHEYWIEHFQYIEANIAGQPFRVHSGFWSVLEPHLEALSKKVKLSMGSHTDLVVVGFGQGGAVANLFALYAQLSFAKRVTLLTYGAPRVGDSSFAQSMESNLHKVVRVVRPGDPYTTVPTTSCKNFYRCMGGEMPFVYYVHAGKPITLPASQGTHMCDKPLFHDEHVDGGLGHIQKLKKNPELKQCFDIHSFQGYSTVVAQQVPEDSPAGCTKPSFAPLPPPPPTPAPIIKNLYIEHPPTLKNWGPSAAWEASINSHDKQ
jgi:hypothetical protein